ncbi:unnamed protein product [Allacma fusca]|uniref:CCHC-type domain-containing protein n=1 Tax=Allacma fusca TaxID=39272 RepID=A0A8J2JTK7_9HEXA|nr:unnamed protein product [Allacma fusca]
MQALKLKRGTLKSSLTKLKNTVDGYTDAINQGYVEAHQRRLDGLWAELQKNHDEIIAASADDNERDAHQLDFDEVDSKVMEIQCSLNNAMLLLTRPPTSCQNTSAQTQDLLTPNLSVNLPKLSIPTYSGEVHEWLGFSDMFTTMVHNNQTLQDVNRFQYLKLALRGDAARHLNSIPVTNANYQKAWDMLEARFSHERVMVFSHLDRLFNNQSLPQESAVGLRKLIDNTMESVRALENLKRDTGHWDDILVYVTMQKLDPETRRRIELSLTDKKVPTFDQLMILLEQHSIALDTMSNSKGKGNSANDSPKKFFGMNEKPRPAPGNVKSHVVSAQDKNQCSFCSETHNIFQCPIFNGKSIPERLQTAKEKKLCLNCLRTGHFVSSCPSTFVCRVCKQKHHSLLHQIQSTDSVVVTNHASNDAKPATQVLLGTAVVHANDHHGALQTCRVLLDTGSQVSFITSACVNRLGLRLEATFCQVTGIASCGGPTADSQVNVQLVSRFEEATFAVTALVVKQVTASVNREPQVFTHVAQFNLESTLQRFWEIEEISESRKLTGEEKACETHFAETHVRNLDGS